MSQYDRSKASRLPQWRSYETDADGPESRPARAPVLRPGDFAKARPVVVTPTQTPAAEPAAEIKTEAPVVVEEPVQPASKPTIPDASLSSIEAPPAPHSGPLLDVGSAIAAIWRRRLIVLGLAGAGAVAGGVVVPTLPQKFTATASLYFDPNQIVKADNSSSSGPSPEMLSALVDSQTQILTSGNVLRRVAEAMNLYQDPEFTGGRPDGAAVISALQKAVVITRQTTTYVVTLAATTRDPQKSAKLANQVVASFLTEENSASSGLYENATSTLDARLNDLRQKVQEAEQAVETYRADNDMASTQQGLISDQRLTSLNALLVTAQDKTIQAKARADAASNLSFEQVVATGPQDQNATSTALSSLRQQYAAQAALIGNLQSQMGARHPRLQAARSSLQSIAGEIRSELERIAVSARAQYDQARKAEESISKELSVQKALQVTTSDRQVELNELERKAAAARDIYASLLKRSDQTTEDQNLSRNNMRVISEAEAPVKADGPSKKMLLVAGIIGGLLAGFAVGAAFAILTALFTHPTIRGYFRKPA
ncbi:MULTISPECIES: GumC family protein [unclassified Rhizobium]|jgi:uncharacterized protein involved in exopolysaccharide biosynthesis|uniref:GumC family protein n=1 Tax=unclassified Rhizobium TaxID=2613769 RepID=UPI000DDB3711|nr:GNVR domain-containing protein [Rhizobium sp. UBA1881]